MTPELLRLASAIAAGASPAHLEALRHVRDTGSMFAEPARPDARGARHDVVRSLWAWRAVEARHRPGVRGNYSPPLTLTAMGSAVLFYAHKGTGHDARTAECA